MSSYKLAATLILISLASMVGAFVIGPKGIYATRDFQRRVEIIEESKAAWLISQSVFGISLVLTATGFTILGLNLRAAAGNWIPTLAAGLLGIGSISGLIFVYRQTVDPLSSYQGAFSSFESLYYWLAVVSLILFGVAFLQADLPAWLGFATSGAAVVFGIFYLITGSGFLTPAIVALLSLMIALYFLRQ